MALLEVRDLSVRFTTDSGAVRAVSEVSFDLAEGETLGLVGESGSGKSVTSLAVMGLVPSPPGTVDCDRISFRGRDLFRLPESERRSLRGNEISMIFQDPMTSLNPLLTIERQLTEVLQVHRGASRREARSRAVRSLGDVGIPAPEARLELYPHELSGGMRQRVMIAMALLCGPAVLFADEPTTALDVTIQAQILDLLKALQERHGMSIVMITHDLGVVAGLADRVHVMYAGRLVETGPTRPLFRTPAHPYTRALLKSVPTLDGDPLADLPTVEGQPPDLARLPLGCAFAPRCVHAGDRCLRERPRLDDWAVDEEGGLQRSACFEAGRLPPGETRP